MKEEFFKTNFFVCLLENGQKHGSFHKCLIKLQSVLIFPTLLT